MQDTHATHSSNGAIREAERLLTGKFRFFPENRDSVMNEFGGDYIVSKIIGEKNVQMADPGGG